MWKIKINTKRISEAAGFGVNTLLALVFSVITALSVLLLSYLLGSWVLQSDGIVGSDSTYHLAWIHVLDRFWPQIPLWFPYAGAGSSIVFGYWVVPYYAVLKIVHSSSFSIEQAFRLLQFITVPVVAFELYLFGWLRLRNHVVGLIAALLYPLSSMAWGWIAHAGFFAMHLSLTMVIPALIFYDAYLEYWLEGKADPVARRLVLLGSGVFIAASLVTHLAAGASLLLGLPIYTLARVLLKLRRKGVVKVLLRGFRAFLTAVVVGIALSAFLLLPQRRYFDFQALDFTPVFAAHEFPQLPWRGYLGFERLENVGSLHTPLFLSRPVVILGFAGIIFGLLFRSSTGAVGLLALFYVWWMGNTRFLASHFPFLNTFLLPTNLRVAGIPGALFPLLAAFGIWSFVDVPGKAIRYLFRKSRWTTSLLLKPVSFAFAAVIAVLLAAQLVYQYRSLQESGPTSNYWAFEGEIEGYHGYGALGFPLPYCKVPGWRDVGMPTEKECEKLFEGLKSVEIETSGKDPLAEMDFDEKMERFAFDEGTRVAVSSRLGSFMQAFNGHSRASMLNSPSGQSVLNISWHGIQDQAFYQEGDVSAEEVSELAKWFGIKYVFLAKKGNEAVYSRYPERLWTKVETFADVVDMFEFNDAPGISVVSNKPAVLVIGSHKKRAYQAAARAVVGGALSYDDALLVKGREKIDTYSLSELNEFQAIILHGYSYRNRRKAWNLLSEYVKQGGGLFVDTGWQYVARDWKTAELGGGEKSTFVANLSEPFPVKKTVWGEVGPSWEGFILGDEERIEVDPSAFGPLTWEDRVWSLAYADRSDLVTWAEPVLYSEDAVLIAKGKLGEGKVVWSGMNILAHAYDKDSRAEYELLRSLFAYLFGKATGKHSPIEMDHSYPDKAEFFLTPESWGAWLYWAETYIPDWKAYLVDGDSKTALEIHPAGPGFQAVRLPELSSNAKIEFVYDLRKIFILSFGMTIGTLLLLGLSIVDALFLRSLIEKRVSKRFKKHFGFLVDFCKRKLAISLHDEEDY